MDVKGQKQTDKEYMDQLLERGSLPKASKVRNYWYISIGLCLWMVIAGGLVLRSYLKNVPNAAIDDQHFLYGAVACLVCLPGALLLAVVISKVLSDFALQEEERPYGLLIRFYKKMQAKGIDPFEKDE